MQALNSLATPEEKLAALCKKYADLVSRTCEYLHLNSYSSSYANETVSSETDSSEICCMD